MGSTSIGLPRWLPQGLTVQCLKAGSRPGCRLCSRYLFLLAGGGALAVAAMGAFAVLVFIPALCTVVLIHSLGPQDVHRPTFLFQMTWQTLCHLGLHYTEYYLQDSCGTWASLVAACPTSSLL